MYVFALDLRLNGREFDSQPPHHGSVGIGMGDRLRASIPPRHITSHKPPRPTQPSTLCGTGNELVPAKVR